ncbi:MAG: glycosyltransferase family 2 protein [Gammaproteobacteria bacterium]
MNLNELTVIVPTRNEEKNIPRFLASVPEAAELIVVDASDDRTVEILKHGRRCGLRILRYYGNISQARQLGADSARTRWLLFSDADIEFPPEYFARVLGHEDDDIVYGPKLSRDFYIGYYQWFARTQRLSHALGLPAACGSNLLVRQQVLHAVGGFDPELACNEDSEFVWRAKRGGFRVTFDPALLVYARDHRRLHRGRWRKTAHSIVRCLTLYFDLLPSRWRRHDWGYWSPLESDADNRRGQGE